MRSSGGGWCRRALQPVIADAALPRGGGAAAARAVGRVDLGAVVGQVKQATGTKGKALFQPLRLALTGREHGPELKQLLPLIGRARAQPGSKARPSQNGP